MRISGAFNSSIVNVVMRRAFCVGCAKRRLGVLRCRGWETAEVQPGLQLAICFADIAVSITLDIWSTDGVSSTTKADDRRVTEADITAEHAVRARITETRPDDGFLSEVVGTTRQRWIVGWLDDIGFVVAG